MAAIEVTTPHSTHPQNDDIVKPAKAAELLGISVNTLAAWRSNKRIDPPLPYVKVGARVFYRRSDLSWWLNERSVSVRS